ncbi:hypothetical protein BaRGS_00034211 [Batillaria attramentaria]|uniref:RGS domain-containing protein n=1 Tax=Batillaria attramentaria TaxID=370345 RepID=A0ABD0JHX8_9CAEN
MADLEAVLADVSYLMAMEKSKSTPAARASKKIVLPDPSVRSIMHKHLTKVGEVTFDKIFNQKLGYLLFKDFCENVYDEPVPQLKFYEENGHNFHERRMTWVVARRRVVGTISFTYCGVNIGNFVVWGAAGNFVGEGEGEMIDKTYYKRQKAFLAVQ